MAKLRSVNTHFWVDGYIVNLDPIEKLLFLYLITNPLCNIAGCYEISIRQIAFDTGIDKDMVQKILDRFQQNNKLEYRNGWLLLVNFVKNQNLNDSMRVGVENILTCCPDWVKDRLSQGGDRLSHPARIGIESNRIELEDEKEDECESQAENSTWQFPMKPLVDAFPEYLDGRITPAMIGFIEADVGVADTEAWLATIEIYKMNFNPMLKRYLPDKTANLLGVFRKQKAELEKKKNGPSRSNSAKRTAGEIIRNRPYRRNSN